MNKTLNTMTDQSAAGRVEAPLPPAPGLFFIALPHLLGELPIGLDLHAGQALLFLLPVLLDPFSVSVPCAQAQAQDQPLHQPRNDDPALANRLFLFTDATWADCEDTRKSTTGMVLHLNGGPTSWKSKRQPIIAQSSCESEIIAATYGANEACFVRELLTEIGLPPHTIRAYEDNTSTRQLANDPGKLRNRSKHFELRG